jgi:hypothetical protein
MFGRKIEQPSRVRGKRAGRESGPEGLLRDEFQHLRSICTRGADHRRKLPAITAPAGGSLLSFFFFDFALMRPDMMATAFLLTVCALN